MGEIAVPLGTPTGTPTYSAASWLDAGGRSHQEMIAQYFKNGTTDPVSVNDTTQPMPVQLISGAVAALTDESAFVEGTGQGLPLFAECQPSTTNLAAGEVGILRCSPDRRLHVTAGGACAQGGWNAALVNSITTSPVVSNLKATYGIVYGFSLTNNAASAWAYLRFYDAATIGAVALGTTTPIAQFGIPPGGGNDPMPLIQFLNGICWTLTLNPVALDDTALGGTASAVTGTIYWG